jgi:UTP--glucose-1-phosphate uridylyltransferase
MAKALEHARAKMDQAGIDPVAIDVFTYYFALLESGETGMVPESTIDPLDMESLADVEVDEATGREALAHTAVIKLNGGLGTSMGLDSAKSLLEVREGLTFLDIAVRQILWLRERYAVRLPLLVMNSFRTSADTLAALRAYPDLAVDDLPLEFLQNKVPKLLVEGLDPVEWPADPDLEWCPPGHGDIYTSLWSTGLLDRLGEAGFERVFVSNSDNLGAVPDPRVAGWFAQSGAPFAIEAVRRTPSDRKGGHFARRKSDGRIVLRETAQTLPEDLEALADLDRHRFSSTNNLWFDVAAMRAELQRRHGVLGLAMIKNVKTVDPTDPVSPEVVQLETAMGAAIETFDGATTIEVGRDRFVPVKTTNDLLVVRSDCYQLDEDSILRQTLDHIPFVDLDESYKLVADFDARFPEGVPSLRRATSLRIRGDWAFEAGVRCEGEVELGPEGSPGHIPAGTTLRGPADD